MPSPDDALTRTTASPVAIEAIVGGIYEVVYSRVTSDRTKELPSLLPSLLHSALLPFVGPEIADAEYQRVTLTANTRNVPTS